MPDSKPADFLWADLFKRRGGADPVLEVLKQNYLFCTLEPAELQYLAKRVYVRAYESEEPVFTEGDRGFGMFMIAKGQVSIKTRANGGEVLVTTLGAGSFFGEMTLIRAEAARSASAVATEPSRLVGFFKPDLLDILERKPAMGVKILLQLSRVLEERLLATTERVTHGFPKAA